jgi:serine protease
VAFTYTVDGLAVSFTNTSKGATTWAWAFGDGSTSGARHPVHTYARAGEYVVTLTAVGDNGATASAQQRVTVGP